MTPRAGFSALLPWLNLRLARGLLFCITGIGGDTATERFTVIVILVVLLIVSIVIIIAVVMR